MIRVELLLLFEQVLQRNLFQVILDHLLQTFPHRECRAEFAARAECGIAVKTGDRRESAFRQCENLADGICARFSDQSIAALITSVGAEEVGAIQNRYDLLQIFFGYVLPLGDVLKRDESIALMLRQVDHHAQRIAPLR